MSKPKTRPAETVDRRGFLRTGAAAVVSAAAAGPIASAAGETPANSEPIATRSFGKTEQKLPILGYGGAALIKGAGNPLSNIQTLAGDATYTNDDRALLAEFSAKAFDSDAIKRMKVE